MWVQAVFVGASGYDSEDRLVNWQRSDNNLTQAWNLSLVGDWNSITENSQTQSRTHGPTHELQAVAGQAVQRDVKGNMTLIPANLRPTTSGTPQPLSMSWDFDNRLVSADTNNDSTADVFYKWDALGRRVYRDDGTTATVYVQSGQQTIADYTAGTAATSPTYTYVYASYIDEPVIRSGSGNLVYLHRNQQYSVVALTNGGGTITERYAYSAYGTPTITDASGTTRTTTTVGNRCAYTGREYDESLSLYHYRARMYDSAIGRFCSRDPLGYKAGSNQYEYVDGKSPSNVDPTGFAGIPVAVTPGFVLVPCPPSVYAGVAANCAFEGRTHPTKLPKCYGDLVMGAQIKVVHWCCKHGNCFSDKYRHLRQQKQSFCNSPRSCKKTSSVAPRRRLPLVEA
jgi:RHS repeat-associated protein